jgi:hypothetical protein
MTQLEFMNALRTEEISSILQRHHDFFAGKDLLEIGSGTGVQLLVLRDACKSVTGIEIKNAWFLGGGTIPIHGRTIDSLNLPPIDVCKMDIEGAELGALTGMQRTLQRSPGMKLLIEYNRLSDRAALLAFIRSQFRHVRVAARGELNGQEPPADCNLWAWN